MFLRERAYDLSEPSCCAPPYLLDIYVLVSGKSLRVQGLLVNPVAMLSGRMALGITPCEIDISILNLGDDVLSVRERAGGESVTSEVAVFGLESV
jgi:hypothetical protein